MNLREATEAALVRRYRSVHAPAVRQRVTPVTTEAGQQGRIKDLMMQFKGDRKAAAAAIGVPRDTLTRWINGKRGISKASQGKLEQAYQKHIVTPKQQRADLRARKQEAKTNPPRSDAKVKVTATIRWSKSPKKKYNRRPYRTTTLDHIDLSKVAAAWAGGRDPGKELEKVVTTQYGTKDGVAFEGDSVEIEFLE